jgi:hypothetical protein
LYLFSVTNKSAQRYSVSLREVIAGGIFVLVFAQQQRAEEGGEEREEKQSNSDDNQEKTKAWI